MRQVSVLFFAILFYACFLLNNCNRIKTFGGKIDTSIRINTEKLYAQDAPLEEQMRISDIISEENPREGCAWLFEDCEYEGDRIEICGKLQNLGADVQSIKLGPGTLAALYTESDFEGEAMKLKKNVSCFENKENLADFDIRSIKVKAAKNKKYKRIKKKEF
jgi:hypothetical protein